MSYVQFAYLGPTGPTAEEQSLMDASGVALTYIGDIDPFEVRPSDLYNVGPFAGVIVTHPAAAMRLASEFIIGVFHHSKTAPLSLKLYHYDDDTLLEINQIPEEEAPTFYILEWETLNQDNSHYFGVSTDPGRCNMSGEVKLDGWLGTTNNVSLTAHGTAKTLNEAKEIIARLTQGDFRDYSDAPDPDLLYCVAVGRYETWNANDSKTWCYESMKQTITAYTSDEELDAWVEECRADLITECGAELNTDAVTEMATAYRSECKETLHDAMKSPHDALWRSSKD